ncbi:Elp3 domain-containing protein [Mycena sanguinolenta]|uniref:Elp3 domain-containing protein n=1 Tax=Mycena sanguinolenta TaxID=230812 RepID=A0A8H6Y313_9AGAR|nr:Elp3 domain-containing protein [Mycena sanguinolenta]
MRPSPRWLSTLTSHIEVERKFHPTRSILDALTRPNVPNLASIGRVHLNGVHFVRDLYYDRADERLVKAGIWVRRRSVFVPRHTSSGPNSSSTSDSIESSSWEAKIRVGGNFAASQFVEVQGADAVEQEILRVLGPTSIRVDLDKIDRDLQVMCDLTTRRLEGTLFLNEFDNMDAVNGRSGPLDRLTVVMDQVVQTPQGDFPAARTQLEGISTDVIPPAMFFHEIGELEVMEEVCTDTVDEDEHASHRKTVAARRASQLEAFMLAHPSLFPMDPKPLGKLEAYFSWAEAAKREGHATD